MFFWYIVGMSLIAWGICGLISIFSALCYAELGSMLKESGGCWAYVRIGFGGGPAFIAAFAWIFSSLGSFAVLSMVAAQYLLMPFLDECSVSVGDLNMMLRYKGCLKTFK